MEHKYHYIDMSYINEMSDGDADFATEIITDYLQKIPGLLAELADAGNKQDSDAIVFIVHKMKSSFQFLGTHQLASIAEEIEHLCKAPAFSDKTNDLIRDMIAAFENVKIELHQELANNNAAN